MKSFYSSFYRVPGRPQLFVSAFWKLITSVLVIFCLDNISSLQVHIKYTLNTSCLFFFFLILLHDVC